MMALALSFFSDRNSGWILHIEIICDDVYTYVPPPPAKTEKMSIKKFIHQSSPNVTFTTNSDLPITRTFGIFSTSFSDQQKDLLRFP